AIELRWKFSLQVRGDGPIRMIANDYYAPEEPGAPARMRADAGFDHGDVLSSRLSPVEMLGKGVLGVSIDQGKGMLPYQGITPLSGGSLAACGETYFAQSEQLATRFAIQGAQAQEPGQDPHWRVGGIMVQQLPSEGGVVPDAPSGEDGLMSADDVAEMGDRAEDWNRVNMLLGTVEVHELVGPHVAPENVLYRLFHEEAPAVFDAQPVQFGCTCSAERVEAALHQYSAKDISTMTNEAGKVTADCQFCSAHYEFEPETLGFEAEG
ncbi:MAG: Hsp33 family molecular chaperone HslO, partial [Pseudomonadota bacterium]